MPPDYRLTDNHLGIVMTLIVRRSNDSIERVQTYRQTDRQMDATRCIIFLFAKALWSVEIARTEKSSLI